MRLHLDGLKAAGEPQPGRFPLNRERLGVLYRERLGVLCGNHIRRQVRKRIGVSVFTKGAYTLRKNACYADSETATGSYTETI